MNAGVVTAEQDPPQWLVTRDSARLLEHTPSRTSREPAPSKDADHDDGRPLEPAFCAAATVKL